MTMDTAKWFTQPPTGLTHPELAASHAGEESRLF